MFNRLRSISPVISDAFCEQRINIRCKQCHRPSINLNSQSSWQNRYCLRECQPVSHDRRIAGCRLYHIMRGGEGTLWDLPTGGVWSLQARPDTPLLDSTRCSVPTLLHLQKPVFRHTLHQPQEQQEHRSLCFVLITANQEHGCGNLMPKADRLPLSPPPPCQGERERSKGGRDEKTAAWNQAESIQL